MKTVFLIVVLIANIFDLKAQSPRISKYEVGTSKAHVYLFEEPTWEVVTTDDGSVIYLSEHLVQNSVFGVFMQEFKSPNEYNKDELNEFSIAFTYYVGEFQLELTEFMDPGLGHTLDSNLDAVGVLYYASNKDGTIYKLMSWADNNRVVVMYVSNTSEANFNYQELFFNGFRFPE